MRCCFNLRILRALAAAAALRRCSAATETPKSAACNWWRPCCPGGRLGIPTTLVHTPERRATSPRFRPRVRTRAVGQTAADSRPAHRSAAIRHLAQQIMNPSKLCRKQNAITSCTQKGNTPTNVNRTIGRSRSLQNWITTSFSQRRKLMSIAIRINTGPSIVSK